MRLRLQRLLTPTVKGSNAFKSNNGQASRKAGNSEPGENNQSRIEGSRGLRPFIGPQPPQGCQEEKKNKNKDKAK